MMKFRALHPVHPAQTRSIALLVCFSSILRKSPVSGENLKKPEIELRELS
jgi:hypothetical protein